MGSEPITQMGDSLIVDVEAMVVGERYPATLRGRQVEVVLEPDGSVAFYEPTEPKRWSSVPVPPLTQEALDDAEALRPAVQTLIRHPRVESKT